MPKFKLLITSDRHITCLFDKYKMIEWAFRVFQEVFRVKSGGKMTNPHRLLIKLTTNR